MASRLTILGVHLLGDHRNSHGEGGLEKSGSGGLSRPIRHRARLQIHHVRPDFAKRNRSRPDTFQAVWKLTSSAVTSTFRREKGLVSKVSDRVRWTAGYVVAWVEEDSFKQATRKLVLDALREYQPDIFARPSRITRHLQRDHPPAGFGRQRRQRRHGQNALRHVGLTDRQSVRRSQPHDGAGDGSGGEVLASPFQRTRRCVYRADSDSRSEQLQSGRYAVRQPQDGAITRPKAISAIAPPSTTYARRPIAEETLAPANVKSVCIDGDAADCCAARRRSDADTRRCSSASTTIRIRQPLEGCVNDVFRMSEVLQECGFPADSIRVCLDERATAARHPGAVGVVARRSTTQRRARFFYSGHGAQIPEYGEDNEPDRITESLVPYDFDWTPEHAITDDRIYSLYSQLPYDTRLAMIFDCCHSGGIHRAGMPRPKGTTLQTTFDIAKSNGCRTSACG